MRLRITKAGAANALLALGSLAVAIVLLEGLARLLPERLFAYNEFFRGDPLLGVPLLNPDPRKDFPEHVKPADVYRIVVLGDSHTVSVKNEDSYPEVLERLLNADAPRKRVEIYNAGAPGHSHYQYYLTLRERMAQFQPDLAIVGFYVGNDFLDLYRNDDRPILAFESDTFVHRPPEFFRWNDPNAAQTAGKWRLAQVSELFLRKTIGYQLSRVKAIWALGKQSGAGNVAAAKYLYTISRGGFTNQHAFRQGMNQLLFLKSFPGERRVLDRVNRRVTETMKELGERTHTRLLYVPIPTRLQVEPDADRAALEKILALCGFDRSALGVEDELYESLITLLGEQGIESLRVRDPLRDAAKTRVLYDETYHISPEAHAIVARLLYERVRVLLASEPAA